MKPIFAVDVDGVVVDSNKYWFDDLVLTTKKEVKFEDVKHIYNLSEVFKTELFDRGFTGFEWWKSKSIYDYMEPIEGSIDTLSWASEFFSVRFVSVILGMHGCSKADFIKRYFPFQEGIYWTREKGGVKHDIVIDDRYNNLNNYTDAKLSIYYDYGCEQSEKSTRPFVSAKNWKEVKCHLERYL